MQSPGSHERKLKSMQMFYSSVYGCGGGGSWRRKGKEG